MGCFYGIGEYEISLLSTNETFRLYGGANRDVGGYALTSC